MSTRLPLLVGGGLVAALIVTAGCNPPGSTTAATSDTSAAAKSYVAPGREGRVLPVLLGRPLGSGVRRGPAVDAPHLDHPGLRAVPGHRLRLRRGIQGDDGQVHLGRRAPPRAVAKRRRLRRPLAVRQRQRQQPHRPHRPPRLQDPPDPRADPELERQSRVVVRDREQRVRAGGVALLGAAAQGPLRRSVVVRDRVQRHGQRHPRRPQERRDERRLADSHPAVQLGPRIHRQGPELGLGVLDVLQLRDGAPVRSKRRRRRANAITPPSSTGAQRSRR